MLSISRSYLHSLGLTIEQITRLTDEDMQRIAATYNKQNGIGFADDITWIVSLALVEKGWKNAAREREDSDL